VKNAEDPITSVKEARYAGVSKKTLYCEIFSPIKELSG